METKKLTVDIEDFDLTKEFELFEVIHAISQSLNKNEIKSYIVMGHELKNSSDRRNFEYILMSYPISIYVQQVENITLRDLRRDHYTSKDKNELVSIKKKLLSDNLNLQLGLLDKI